MILKAKRLRINTEQPYPIIIGPICIYSWKGIDIRLWPFKLFLTVIWRHKAKMAYISPNGTPNKAIYWLWGKDKN